jgi:cytoskeletal protein RodZ
MHLPSKTPLIIFGLAFTILAILAFPIVKSRYFQNEQKNAVKKNSSEISNVPSSEKVDSANSEELATDENDDEENLNSEIVIEDDSFLEILPSDCKNGCVNLDLAEDIEYCKQYCGLVTTPKTAKGCDELTSLEKDYCLKDEAIQKKDGKICNQIEDDGIKKSCFNRLTEDVIEKQISE